MPRPKSWPLKIRSGQSVVTIYRVTLRGEVFYQLRWEERGEIQRRTIGDEKQAREEAQSKADQLQAGETDSITLDTAQTAIYRHALKACGDVPLDVVCREWSEARRRLRGVNLLSVVDEHVKRHSGEDISLPRAVDAFLLDLGSEDVTQGYVDRLGERLKKLSATLGEKSLRSVTESELRQYIDSLEVAPRTKKNVRDGIVTLWRWARREGYLPRDMQTEAERVEAPQIKRQAKIGIFSPEEMRKLLAAASRDARPVIAICGFAGVRSEGEITRLNWEAFRWEQGIIEVTESKTGARRIVPIQANLAAWLADHRKKTGPVIVRSRIASMFRHAAKTAGIDWKHNGLRHSYGSYRVASTKSIDQTSLEMGNSPAMVKKHYLEAVHEKEAAEWFSITPAISLP